MLNTLNKNGRAAIPPIKELSSAITLARDFPDDFNIEGPDTWSPILELKWIYCKITESKQNSWFSYHSSAYGVVSLNSLLKFSSCFIASWATFDCLPVDPHSYDLIDPKISIFVEKSEINNEKLLPTQPITDKNFAIAEEKKKNKSQIHLQMSFKFDSGTITYVVCSIHICNICVSCDFKRFNSYFPWEHSIRIFV